MDVANQYPIRRLMKIIKEFSDPEFHDKRALFNDGEWFWGLGEDGNLYCRWTPMFGPYEETWFEVSQMERILPLISLREMKRIVKEFGHLLVWL